MIDIQHGTKTGCEELIPGISEKAFKGCQNVIQGEADFFVDIIAFSLLHFNLAVPKDHRERRRKIFKYIL